MGAEAGAGNTEASVGTPQVTAEELNARLARPDKEIRGSLFAKVGHILKTYADFVKNPIGFVIGYFKRNHDRREEDMKVRVMQGYQDLGNDPTKAMEMFDKGRLKRLTTKQMLRELASMERKSSPVPTPA